MSLTEHDRALLANALRAAASVYLDDAAAPDGIPRLAAQFERQAAEARALAERIEQAERIEIQD